MIWWPSSPGPDDLVVHFCGGTIAVRKACMLLSEHLRFVGCENDKGCVKEALPGSVEGLCVTST